MVRVRFIPIKKLKFCNMVKNMDFRDRIIHDAATQPMETSQLTGERPFINTITNDEVLGTAKFEELGAE